MCLFFYNIFFNFYNLIVERKDIWARIFLVKIPENIKQLSYKAFDTKKLSSYVQIEFLLVFFLEESKKGELLKQSLFLFSFFFFFKFFSDLILALPTPQIRSSCNVTITLKGRSAHFTYLLITLGLSPIVLPFVESASPKLNWAPTLFKIPI